MSIVEFCTLSSDVALVVVYVDGIGFLNIIVDSRYLKNGLQNMHNKLFNQTNSASRSHFLPIIGFNMIDDQQHMFKTNRI